MGTVVQNPIQYVLCAMSCTLCYVFGGSRHYGQQYTRFTITDLVDVRHVHVAVRHARRLVRARLAVAPCPSWLTPRRLQTNFNQTGKNQNRASLKNHVKNWLPILELGIPMVLRIGSWTTRVWTTLEKRTAAESDGL